MKGTSLSRLAISGDLLARALVAQWIEQRTSNPSVAGSNPAGRAVYRLASPPRLSVPSDSFRLRAQRGHISTGSRAAPNQRWGGMGGASPQSVIDATAADLTRRLELRRLEALSAAVRHAFSNTDRGRDPALAFIQGMRTACSAAGTRWRRQNPLKRICMVSGQVRWRQVLIDTHRPDEELTADDLPLRECLPKPPRPPAAAHSRSGYRQLAHAPVENCAMIAPQSKSGSISATASRIAT